MTTMGYTKAGADVQFSSADSTNAYATVEQSGTSTIARQVNNGAIIKQGTSPAVVIQAALNAAAANTGGGMVRLGNAFSGSFAIDTPIVGPAKTGLFGRTTYVRSSTTPIGSVLKANGLGTGDAVVQSGGMGFNLEGIGIHANNQADYAFAHLNGADVNLTHCVFSYSNQANVYHNPSAGGYAFVMANCELWKSGNFGFRCAGGTDGRISNCGIFESATVCCSLEAGGWLLSGCHITHSSSLTTQVNTQVLGSTCLLTGNYFDSCKNGPTLKLTGSGNTVVGNYVLNRADNNGGTVAIALTSAFGSHVAHNTTNTQGGTGMQWTTGGLPTSGVYGPNFHLNSAKGYVDSSGTAVPVQTTATLYVGPNVTS